MDQDQNLAHLKIQPWDFQQAKWLRKVFFACHLKVKSLECPSINLDQHLLIANLSTTLSYRSQSFLEANRTSGAHILRDQSIANQTEDTPQSTYWWKIPQY